MAHPRATIAAHALDDARIDLTPVRDRRTPVEAPSANAPIVYNSDELPPPSNELRQFLIQPLAAAFPSVAKASAKDRLVSYSVRLKLSQIERLEELKTQRGIVPSELLRDFIDRCLPQV